MHEEQIVITSDGARMEGAFALPDQASGIVLFAHSGPGGRSSMPDTRIAGRLREAGIGTLLIELLEAQEEKDYYTRFDITLLTQRLDQAAEWLRRSEVTRALPLGLFGASTGAAAACQLAAWRGNGIAAVVSLGGRVDMTGRQALDKVRAPTLLIVGGLDHDVVGLNRMAFSALHCDKQLEVINGAGHLFEEAGALDAAIALTRDWFTHHFNGRSG